MKLEQGTPTGSGLEASQLSRLYLNRFSREEEARKDELWEVLCRSFLQRFVPADAAVLDLACGNGEFSRHIQAREHYAVDLKENAQSYLPAHVQFRQALANNLDFLADASIDICFTSNFFEHLPSKPDLDAVVREVGRVLRPGGRFIAIQPNIRYAPGKYWDFYDHYLPLSDLSCAECFELNGLQVETLIARFLPWSTKSRVPKSPFLLRCYLRMPILWRFFGEQFLIIGRKPGN